jgi:hypothetical protein
MRSASVFSVETCKVVEFVCGYGLMSRNIYGILCIYVLKQQQDIKILIYHTRKPGKNGRVFYVFNVYNYILKF